MPIKVSLLGGFQAHDKRGLLLAFPTKKTQALLAYLAIRPGQAQPRDKLAALLWGDSTAQQARASLRQTLSLLGKALAPSAPECLVAAAGTIALDPTAVEIDVVRFEAAVREQTPSALERAMQLYQGDLLEGLTVEEALFEDWLAGERARLRALASEALSKLLAHHQAAEGGAERAIETALRLLALDNLQEGVHRMLMRLYARQGRQAAALRQYQACVALLQRELGAEPETATQQLYQEILQRRPAAGVASGQVGSGSTRPTTLAVRTAPATHTPDTSFIGREAELVRLRAVLDDVARGSGRTVMILGEAGIGKTRVLEELALEALKRGAKVLLGHCYATEQILPFHPFVSAIKSGQVLTGAQDLQALSHGMRAALMRLFPELDALGADLPNAPDNPLELFESLAELFGRLGADAPLVVLLEDLHWADEMSLRLLAFLARRAASGRLSGRLLIVGTAREEELADAPLLARALEELAREPSCSRLRLDALSHAQTLEFARALSRVGAGDGQRLGERIWRASEGNPFVALETMRAIQDGRLEADPHATHVPAAVRQLVAQRLDQLGAPARRVLAVASVVKGEFDFCLLQRATGLTIDAAAAALEELVRRRVLQGVGARFDFMHERVRQVAEDSLLDPRRRALHATVAEALEALHAQTPEQVFDRLAYHYSKSEHRTKALEYLVRFADQAARGGGHEEAIAALDQALLQVEHVPVQERARQRLDLLLRQARSLFFLGRLPEVLRLLEGEADAVDALADCALGAVYHFRLGNTYTNLGNRGAALRSARRALDEATRAGDTRLMGKVHYLLAMESFWSHPAEGVESGMQAVRLLAPRESWWLGQAHWILGLNLAYRGRFDEALAAERRAWEIAEVVGDRRLASAAAWTTGLVHTLAGDIDDAIHACQRSVELAIDPVNAMSALGTLGFAYVEKGEPDVATPLLERAVAKARRFHLRLEGLFTTFQGQAALLKGDLVAARAFAETGLEITQRAQFTYGAGLSQRVLARIAATCGDPAGAVARLHEASATFAAMGATFEVGRCQFELAELLFASGRADEAAKVHASAALNEFTSLALPRFIRKAEHLVQAPA